MAFDSDTACFLVLEPVMIYHPGAETATGTDTLSNLIETSGTDQNGLPT